MLIDWLIVTPEAEYTFRLRKRIIPLRLQPGYNPDGWLGALAGSKLVFDCSLPSKLEESIRNVVKELGNVGKIGDSKLRMFCGCSLTSSIIALEQWNGDYAHAANDVTTFCCYCLLCCKWASGYFYLFYFFICKNHVMQYR